LTSKWSCETTKIPKGTKFTKKNDDETQSPQSPQRCRATGPRSGPRHEKRHDLFVFFVSLVFFVSPVATPPVKPGGRSSRFSAPAS